MTNESLDFYDSDLSIRFTQNLRDLPDGYEVNLKGNFFYLPSRCLPELINPNMKTYTLISLLTNINDTVPLMLRRTGISPEQLHIAFLKLGLLRTEKERDYFISQGIK